ncbi:iron transporter [Marinomonas spartinae]|uniref:iron transporter n=1 Tax=Marinomonas spartinae TaxID=1792290 RepID=UPI0018F156B0|nr:iron transporter [Marinomonas spartinae]MBJ7553831.1 iron transporter [Marinomonas spartinae]
MRYSVFCGLLSVCLISVTAQAEEVVNTTLASMDKDGMNLSSGVRLEGKKLVLWSRSKANAYNPNGYITNDFIPFCKVTFEVKKVGTSWHQSFIAPMRLTQTGPEYGQATVLDGAGQYQWTVHYQSPRANGFYRHIDKATGVAPWWKPFDLTYSFSLDSQGKIHKGATS